jgi:hypothetical protein
MRPSTQHNQQELPPILRSMDKLFDLMVMGAKYQLMACTSHDDMLQARPPPLLLRDERHARIAAGRGKGGRLGQ